MDQNNDKKAGGTNWQNNPQGTTDQLIKDVAQITSYQVGKKQNNWNSIKKYKLDNNRMKEKINNVVKQNEVEDSMQKQRIQKIQEQGQQWTKKILIEVERQDLLKKELEEVKKNMQSKNLKLGGGGSQQIGEQISDCEQFAQQKKSNQQKLDKLKAKNNQMVAQIQKLKEEVKVSRNERAFFDNVFKNLERDMKTKEEVIKQFVLDNTLNGYDLKKQEEVSIMISKLVEKEQALFKTAYESQMLSKPTDIYNMDELCQSIVIENSKIKEADEDEDEEDEENNDLQKTDLNQTMNTAKIQEMKYENFLKIKKEFITKMNNDKVEYDNKSESIKKLLLMTNSESIEQFKQDYNNTDSQIEDLYQQSEHLNQEISSLRKQVNEINNQIFGYQEQKDSLIRQMDSKRQTYTEKDKLIKDIQSLEATQKKIRESNAQIEEDLHIFCKLIPPMLREMNVISDEFLRENIHMNIHPNNVLDFFGTIEKKTTLTNTIFNRLQELQYANPNKRKNKKKNTIVGIGNNNGQNNNNSSKLPFNYTKMREREKKQKLILDYIDKMDQEKEADSLLMPSHFKQLCKAEFQKLNAQVSPAKQLNLVRDSIRALSHFSQRNIKKNGVK